jgi:hypothetical protein
MHFGVGILLKGILPRRVSRASFVASQFVIDAEVADFMLVRRERPFHRWAHTFLVGGIVGLAVVLVARVGRRLAGVRWQVPDLSKASWSPALIGGLLGGLTHPVVDGCAAAP